MAHNRQSRGPIGQFGRALVLPFFEISVVQCRTIAPSRAGLGRVAATRPEFVLRFTELRTERQWNVRIFLSRGEGVQVEARTQGTLYPRPSRGPIGQYGHAIITPFFDISSPRSRTFGHRIAPGETEEARNVARPMFVVRFTEVETDWDVTIVLSRGQNGIGAARAHGSGHGRPRSRSPRGIVLADDLLSSESEQLVT